MGIKIGGDGASSQCPDETLDEMYQVPVSGGIPILK